MVILNYRQISDVYFIFCYNKLQIISEKRVILSTRVKSEQYSIGITLNYLTFLLLTCRS